MDASVPIPDSTLQPHGSNIREKTYIYDLDNEIYPIFAQHNFADADYEALEPALRLASHLITNPCLLDYWYAVFFPNIKDITNECGTYQAFFRKEDELTPEDVDAVHLKFVSLAKYLCFER